jgi:hypothetical protein
VFIVIIGMAVADLASAAPTSGGVGGLLFFNPFVDFPFLLSLALFLDLLFLVSSLEKSVVLDSWMFESCSFFKQFGAEIDSLLDANTIGSISAVASIDWGCALQIMAAVKIGSGGNFSATNAQLLYVPTFFFLLFDKS